MRYTIDPETFAVKIFDEGSDVPFQYQPDYPNGDKFDSVEEASAWAEASIAAHDPTVLFYAPNGKNLPAEKKPDLTAKQEILDRLGITAEEAKLLLS